MALILAVGYGAAGTGQEPPPEPAVEAELQAVVEGKEEPTAGPIFGIDVSHYSGAVDWRVVRDAGYAFAYVKATEGVDSPDPLFAEHWQGLAAAGLPRGAYHFYVTEDDPEEQARFFIATVDLGPGDLRPAVDVEVLGHGTEPGLAERLRRFLELLEEHYGVEPILYTAPNFWNANLDDSFGGYDLWIAEYGVDEPAMPTGWQSWLLWQHAGEQTVEGVEKDADLSRLHPDHGRLDVLVIGAGGDAG